jgi:hypothetical protein
MYKPNNKKNQLSKAEQRELLYHAHAARTWMKKYLLIKNN